MKDRLVVGIRPWLPWPLSRWPWWTEPVRAERLAALRIGLATLLLLDLFLNYLPHIDDFFGAGSLGGSGLFSYLLEAPRWYWTVLRDVNAPQVLHSAMLVGIVATVCLLIGFCTRLSAAVLWVLMTSFDNLNHYVTNAGDEVRGIILFYLLISPCGAAWSVDRWLRRRWRPSTAPVYIYPWALRLLFVQLAFIYFCNGMYKWQGATWRAGSSLYYVLGDITLTRWSYAQLPMPYWMTQVLTWSVLVWELAFPLLIMAPWLADGFCRLLRVPNTFRHVLVTLLRWQRTIALFFGVAFHLGILVSMEIGMFAPYMICLYLPLVPWEKWTRTRNDKS